ncbi:MAG: nickel pincer cofactor biosynthesis protein LarC [Melioribacteraceae bacterium]|nr:nickel pincer cofactor biosynthesis protein LarC [Melioribacteraceae bacterium]MCF8263191.1 nickel pincer cofactor biosynthesis protein LarC [Melioribacteraceae bacterium]MCF8430321.1 nickel pincer cofactor biosynthesis protein LarC [Melioribacteraceae bacterium]
MTNILKIEAFSGACGDMFLGALAGLTDRYNDLINLPELLNFENNAEIVISETSKNGIVTKQIKVVDKIHEHVHRHLSHINKIINESGLSTNAKLIALEIFNIIGKAESKVHGIPLEKIHFHEVGAVDSIIDVAGAAYLLDILQIEKTFSTPLTTGKGFVKTAHGMLPVPCPATKIILEGMPTIYGNEDGEKLTPTGAAIIKYLEPEFEMPPLSDIKSAYGAGEKNFETPNVLRLSLVEETEIVNPDRNEVYVIETNLDDFNPEFLGIEFQNELFKKGALDFYFTQVIMKKGRPGVVVSVLCKNESFERISQFLISYTSAIGLRYYKTNRIEMKRVVAKVDSEFGEVKVKKSKLGNLTKSKPEAEDVIKKALELGLNPEFVSKKIDL